MSVSERGEEAGEQITSASLSAGLDLMDKNRIERHGAPGELARGSETQRGSKRLDVNAARVRGKLPHLIRGDLPMRAEVSRGRSSRRKGKPFYKACIEQGQMAKGRTAKELSRKAQNSVRSRHLGGKKSERTQR